MARDKPDSIAKGAALIGAARIAVRIIGTVSTVITARLLTPADFGLVAIAASIQAIIMAGTQFGFNLAIIQFEDAEDQDYCTAWTLDILRGIVLAFIMIALAAPASEFLHSGKLFWILVALALNPLLEGFQNTWFVRYEKDMQFTPIAWLMITVKLSAAVTTVSLAIVTRSYWALIAGMIMSTLFRTIVTHVVCPGPRRFTLKGWRRLMAFSGWLAGAQMVGTMAGKFDDIILQKIMAAHAVGIFYTSRELTTMVFTEIGAPLRRVLFPALSRFKPTSSEFRQLYLMSVSGLVMVLAPLGVGLAIVAGNVVPLLLGPQWSEAIGPIRWLALLMAFQSLGVSALSSITAAGATRALFWRSVVFLPIRLMLFTGGVLWAGLPGAVYGFVASGIVALALNLSLAQIVIGETLLDSLRHCNRTFIALAGMTAGTIALRNMLLHGPILGTNIAQLGISALVGGTLYVLLHLFLWHTQGRPASAERNFLDFALRLARRSHAALRGIS